MTANDWILPWFILVRIMYIMLNNVCVMRSAFLVVVIRSGFKNLSLSSFIIGLCMEK